MFEERSHLQLAQEISDAMFDAAEAGRWADVTRLHNDCADELGSAQSWGDLERQSLMALKTQYQAVMDLASGARDLVAVKLGKQRQAHRALSTYLLSADSA